MPEFRAVRKNFLVDKIARLINGRVVSGENELKRFSRDMSLYRIQPLAVAYPGSVEDIARIMELAAEEGIVVTPRGGGSGTAGAALGRGIVIATEKNGLFGEIMDFRDGGDTACATVGGGVLHERLQSLFRQHGYYLPAEPSSSGLCLLGGNIATKASGPHELRHGSIDRYLDHLCFVTVNGDYIDTAKEETIPAYIRVGLQGLRNSLLADDGSVRLLKKKRGRKIASGYNMFPFLDEMPLGSLLAQLLAGSVGTLGYIVQATIRGERVIPGRATVLLSFESLRQAGEAVPLIREQGAAAIEIISENTIQLVRERLKSFHAFPPKGHVLLVELEGPQRLEQSEAILGLMKKNQFRLAAPPHVADDEASQAVLWKNRKQLLPAILNYKPGWKALPVVNDIGVSPENLSRFIVQVERLFEKYGLQGAVYGHAGSGNLHLRPLFDLSLPRLGELIRTFADEVYYTALAFDGTITAEHGMGRLRAPYLSAEWGDKMVRHMKDLKNLFDPGDLLNPGVMFSSQSILADAAIIMEAN